MGVRRWYCLLPDDPLRPYPVPATCRRSACMICATGRPRWRSLAAGTEIKVISEMLRHSSTQITSDTYTSVLPEAAHQAAGLVPRQSSEVHKVE
jgi:integrase